MRHNEVRDLSAELLRQVCRDVNIEPGLIPLSGQRFSASANHEANARLDVSARDFWSPMDKAFFDVRITHPMASSNRSKPLPTLYKAHEDEKKRVYNERIIEVEKATFTPLVFSTSGGTGKECSRFLKRLASLISIKRNEEYADVISYVRRRLRFCILRTTLIAIRGYRGKRFPKSAADVSTADFNMIAADANRCSD